jgi:hypothetical protein
MWHEVELVGPLAPACLQWPVVDHKVSKSIVGGRAEQGMVCMGLLAQQVTVSS